MSGEEDFLFRLPFRIEVAAHSAAETGLWQQPAGEGGPRVNRSEQEAEGDAIGRHRTPQDGMGKRHAPLGRPPACISALSGVRQFFPHFLDCLLAHAVLLNFTGHG